MKAHSAQKAADSSQRQCNAQAARLLQQRRKECKQATRCCRFKQSAKGPPQRSKCAKPASMQCNANQAQGTLRARSKRGRKGTTQKWAARWRCHLEARHLSHNLPCEAPRSAAKQQAHRQHTDMPQSANAPKEHQRASAQSSGWLSTPRAG